MKKITLILIAITIFTLVSQAQSTAVDFTKTDCDGISRTLYPVLDSGFVVVLVYEHQCSSCLVGSNNLKTTINTYYATTPNIKVWYLDNGGYSCSSTKTWISSHNLIAGPAFQYSSDQSSPYGPGMPVIVVTGSKAHKVYAITNSVNLPTVSKLKTAIDAALADISLGINSNIKKNRSFGIYPNPVTNGQIQIKIKITGVMSYEITNTAGQISVPLTPMKADLPQQDIFVGQLQNGIYFLVLRTSKGILTEKLIINR